MSWIDKHLAPSGVQPQVGLLLLLLTVLVPIVAVDRWNPVHGDANVEFFTTAAGVTVGLLIADLLAASTVVRAFEGHRLALVDRLELIVMVGLPLAGLGISLLRLLVSIANCEPAGMHAVCRSPSIDPNSTLGWLAAGLCLLVGQYAIALVARPGRRRTDAE